MKKFSVRRELGADFLKWIQRASAVFLSVWILFVQIVPVFADGVRGDVIDGFVIQDEAAVPAMAVSEISADVFILMENSTGQVLAEKNSRTRRQPGPLCKLMTVLLTAEAVSQGKLDLSQMAPAGNSVTKASGAVIWLVPGEKMSVEDLLKAVIIGNANDAAVVLAETVAGTEKDFVARMNVRARELGMINTWFQNAAGYDAPDQYTTGYDMALLCQALTPFSFLTPWLTCWMDDLRNGDTQLVNANTLVRGFEGVTGMKASHSEESGWNLALTAEREGVSYTAVILGSSDKDIRFTEGKTLINYGFSAYQVCTPAIPAALLTPIPVKGGVGSGVAVRPAVLEDVVIPVGTVGDVIVEANLPEILEAPVAKNAVLGTLSFYRGEDLLYETPLLAAWEVQKMTLLRALLILFKQVVSF